MASPETSTNVTGVMLETVIKKVANWLPQDATLLQLIEKRCEKDDVSLRQTRIPIMIQGGIPVTQFSADGGDMGLGSNNLYDVATVTPVFFAASVGLTKAAQWSTDSSKKSVENILTEAFTNGNKQLRSTIESLINSDGSGTVGTVTGATFAVGSGFAIPVANPNQFFEGSTYNSYAANFASLNGPFQVITVAVNDGVIIANAVPAGTATGSLLVVAGAPGSAASSLLGIEYNVVDTNVGSWNGLSRSQYPDKIKSPHVSAGGNQISPQLARELEVKLIRTLGVSNNDTDKIVAHMDFETLYQWEQTALSIQTIQAQDVSGDTTFDTLKKNLPKTIGGKPIVASINAQPGRVDYLDLSTWGVTYVKDLALYDEDGMTQFPTYGASGGISTNTLFYYVCGLQLWCNNVRKNGFLDSLAVPF